MFNWRIALSLHFNMLAYKFRFINDSTERNTWSKHVAKSLSYLRRCFKSFVLINYQTLSEVNQNNVNDFNATMPSHWQKKELSREKSWSFAPFRRVGPQLEYFIHFRTVNFKMLYAEMQSREKKPTNETTATIKKIKCCPMK